MKRSAFYRRLRPTLSGPLPADAWHDDQWAIFVFDEDNKEGGADNRSGLVLFAVELQTRSVEEVKLVRVDEAHEEAYVKDLAHDGTHFTAPLPSTW